MPNDDLDWLERAKKDWSRAAFAVICPKCLCTIRDSRTPLLEQPNCCICTDNNAIDYSEVVESHGLGLFKNIFSMQTDSETFKRVGEVS